MPSPSACMRVLQKRFLPPWGFPKKQRVDLGAPTPSIPHSWNPRAEVGTKIEDVEAWKRLKVKRVFRRVRHPGQAPHVQLKGDPEREGPRPLQANCSSLTNTIGSSLEDKMVLFAGMMVTGSKPPECGILYVCYRADRKRTVVVEISVRISANSR